MDYFVRTQYIHDMKWHDIVGGHYSQLAFIHHVLHPLSLLVPQFMYHMSAAVFHYKASVCK